MENQSNKKLPVIDLSDVKCKTCAYKKETNSGHDNRFDRVGTVRCCCPDCVSSG